VDRFDFAIDLIKEAGKLILENSNKITEIKHKGVIDLVTNVDLKSEEFIVNKIKENFPKDAVLAEEGDVIVNNNGIWIIDPIDGTTNFAHNFPHYAISIAYGEDKNNMSMGFVYDPVLGELFYGVKGAGAFLNNKKITVSSIDILTESLLATGFSYDVHSSGLNLNEFTKMIKKVQGIRRAGSAALDLCYVAAGRFEGYWEYNLKPWDIAAGQLIVKEALGEVTGIDGGKLDIYGDNILAANGYINSEMIKVLTKE